MSPVCTDDEVRRGEDSEAGAGTEIVITLEGLAQAMIGMEETKRLGKKNTANMMGQTTPSGDFSSQNPKFRWEWRM